MEQFITGLADVIDGNMNYFDQQIKSLEDNINNFINFTTFYVYGSAIALGLTLIILIIILVKQNQLQNMIGQLIRSNAKLQQQLSEKEVKNNERSYE